MNLNQSSFAQTFQTDFLLGSKDKCPASSFLTVEIFLAALIEIGQLTWSCGID